MPIDWSKVTLDHVRQACDLFDAGAAMPKRPAKSTFLLLNGKSYPAKFIRGLAYRIATVASNSTQARTSQAGTRRPDSSPTLV